MKEFLERISKLSPKRLALLAAQLQARVDALEKAKTEPIAIIGLGCRFPGGGDDPDSFWELLRDGVDAVIEVPSYKWDIDAYYDPDPETPGKMSTRWGGFLEEVDKFDPQFFGIAPREAVGMDPQQRLLLEVTWEALEYAGQSPDSLFGSRTGVFVGIAGSDYFQLQRAAGLQAIDAYLASGSAHSIASGRLSYVLGVQGPSLSIDTACSSSLVAIHEAVQSLRQGECDLALAGGVNLILSPETSITLSKANMMASDGRCKTFDARADGFVRGEGCGMVVLKRLADALADNDNILALVRGTAINQDGRSNGLTAPNGPSQEAVIREALANAGVAPDEISYVETHGTGTSLGDPIEVQALAAVLGQDRAADNPVMLGSVKTNIGHLESAAGVAGLIKLVLALQHRQIPPHLHLQEPNPFIPWDDLPVTVPTRGAAWEAQNGRRLAGLSSLGFSGTNVHLIVGEAPDRQPATAAVERPLHLLTLSAKSDDALQELVARYESHVERFSKSFHDACYTANGGRSHFNHRLALLAGSAAAAREKLAALMAGEEPAGAWRGRVKSARQPKIAFLFTGQGAQYVGMGRGLYDTQPVFRAALDECDALLRPYLEHPLLSVIFAEEQGSGGAGEIPSPRSAELTSKPHPVRLSSRRSLTPSPLLLNETAYTQPALFAIEYALAQLWRSWGVEPAVVMGHSVGEYAAACVAGVFSLEDGLTLIAARGRLMQALPAGGAMAAVFADEATVAEAIAPYTDQVSIAAINGPTNVVISGEGTAVQAILDALKEKGVKSRRLAVSHAFHSPLMAPVLDEFEQVAASVTYNAPRISLIANVTGQLATGAEATSAAYWRDHVRAPVRFADAMQTLHEQGYELFLEIGPQPTLLGMGRRVLESRGAGGQRSRGAKEQGSRGDFTPSPRSAELTSKPHPLTPSSNSLWLPSLRKGRDDWQQILSSLATLYTHGVNVDWDGFDQPYPRQRVVLPTYPFQRERYWVKRAGERGSRGAGELLSPPHPVRLSSRRSLTPSPLHPLLGWQVPTAAISETIFESQISAEIFPYLDDHRIYGTLVLPSPAYMEMALAAATGHFGAAAILEELVIHQAMLLPEDEARTVQLVLTPEDGDTAVFQIFSLDAGETGAWRLHAGGKVRVTPPPAVPQDNLAAVQERCQEQIDVAAYYDSLAELGLHFGPRFQGVSQIWRTDGEALGWMQLPPPLATEANAYQLHPALLDACFHVLGAALPGSTAAVEDAYLLLGLDQMRFYGRPAHQFWNHVQLRPGDGLEKLAQQETFTGDIRLFNEAGEIVAEFAGLHLKRARPETLLRGLPDRAGNMLYEVAWLPQPRQEQSPDYLLSPARVAEQIRPQVAPLSAQHGLDLYEEMLPKLDALCAGYVVHGLRELGVIFREGQRLSPAALIARFDLLDQHTPLLRRMLAMLAEDGALKEVDSEWEVVRVPAVTDPGERMASLLAGYPMFDAELGLTGRCAQSLAGVLRGEVDGLQLLFPGGSLAETEKMYRDSPAARTYNALVQEAITAALSHLPQGRAVRILEIGAGTGGTTSYVLPVLPPDQVEYTFTDISPLFTNKARQTFSQYPFMRYETLDVTADPETQGFTPHSYDLILAANVLHATADLRQTVGNVQKLLAAEGLLIILEGTTPSRFGDLTVGLTEGWWAFTDTDLRPSYALMSRRNWFDLLGEMGFTEATAVPGAESEGALARQAVILARAPKTPVPGHWIIFADEGNVGQKLAQQLETEGDTCILVTAGDQYQAISDDQFQLNPARPEDFRQLFDELLAGDRPACRGVIHLWPLDASLSEETTVETLAQAQAHATGSALHLVQGLVAAAAANPPRLWLVTRNGQPVKGRTETAAAVQASVWGLSNVIALEHPELHCVRVDLEETDDAVPNLFAEIWQRDDREDQIAFRNGRRLVRRLVRSDVGAAAAEPLAFRDDATYLITGGMRGLGLLVAGWMVAHGARHLALMGRSGASEEARQTIAAMEQAGARIMMAQGDVSRQEDVAHILANIEQALPPLRGVIHAAGVLDDGVLLQQNWSRFRTVMAPKVDGTWHLHTLTRHLPLDFMVLFSSGASLLGSAGQGNHAAANAFLDALAAYRQASGLPTTSINWGAWAEVGAAATRDWHERPGIEMIAPTEGLKALARVLQQERHEGLPRQAQIGVLPLDWPNLLAQFPPDGEPPFFREMARETRQRALRPSRQAAPARQEPQLRQRLEAVLPNKRLPLLQEQVRNEAVKVLGLDLGRAFDTHQPLNEMGLDSLMAVELRNKLGDLVGESLPATLIFDYPSVATLADYLARDVLGLELMAKFEDVLFSDEEPQPDAAVDELESLSDDEMALLLAQKLDSLEQG